MSVIVWYIQWFKNWKDEDNNEKQNEEDFCKKRIYIYNKIKKTKQNLNNEIKNEQK